MHNLNKPDNLNSSSTAQQNFARELDDIVRNAVPPFVVGIDGEWGVGKTTFIKNWQTHPGSKSKITNSINNVIYFDAFVHDYFADPLLPIVMTIVDELKKTAKTADAISIKEISRKLFSVAIAATKLGGYGNQIDVIIDLIKDLFDTDPSPTNLVTNEFQQLQQLPDLCKQSLSDLCASYDGKKTVLIIDELDRCQPDFAIRLLERLKHYFAIDNLIVLVVCQRKMLENSAKHYYGDMASLETSWLEKFIDLWRLLPAAEYEDYNKGIQLSPDLDRHRKLFIEWIWQFNLSYRTTDKLINLLNTPPVLNHLRSFNYDIHTILVLFVALVKIIEPSLFSDMRQQRLDLKIFKQRIPRLFPHCPDEYKNIVNQETLELCPPSIDPEHNMSRALELWNDFVMFCHAFALEGNPISNNRNLSGAFQGDPKYLRRVRTEGVKICKCL